jgi:hypothetical protein
LECGRIIVLRWEGEFRVPPSTFDLIGRALTSATPGIQLRGVITKEQPLRRSNTTRSPQLLAIERAHRLISFGTHIAKVVFMPPDVINKPLTEQDFFGEPNSGASADTMLKFRAKLFPSPSCRSLPSRSISMSRIQQLLGA